MIEELDRTVQALISAGVERIAIIGPTPEFPRHVPRCVARAAHYGQPISTVCGVEREVVDLRRTRVVEWLKEGVDGIDNVRFLDPINVFCDEAMCHPQTDHAVDFTDTNHISDVGLERIIRTFEDDIDWLIRGP